MELGVSIGKIKLVNYGPFKEAEIELKPLTIFIGRNSTGKSFLLHTIWMLASTTLDPDLFIRELDRRGSSFVENVKEKISRGENVSYEIKEVIEDYLEVFPRL